MPVLHLLPSMCCCSLAPYLVLQPQPKRAMGLLLYSRLLSDGLRMIIRFLLASGALALPKGDWGRLVGALGSSLC